MPYWKRWKMSGQVPNLLLVPHNPVTCRGSGRRWLNRQPHQDSPLSWWVRRVGERPAGWKTKLVKGQTRFSWANSHARLRKATGYHLSIFFPRHQWIQQTMKTQVAQAIFLRKKMKEGTTMKWRSMVEGRYASSRRMERSMNVVHRRPALGRIAQQQQLKALGKGRSKREQCPTYLWEK